MEVCRLKQDLSPNEWKLMQLLWEESPLTIAQMTERMLEETGWTKYTVISFLTRMEKKGAIRHEEGGRSKLFYPIWEKNEAVQTETRHFLNRVFGGNVGLLVHSMVEADALTQEDIDEMQSILDQARREAREK
jgi:BlaI family penicillinase repressor